MLTYTTEQQRKAEEARRKAEAEAAAERARLAEEQRRQEAIVRQQAERERLCRITREDDPRKEELCRGVSGASQ